MELKAKAVQEAPPVFSEDAMLQAAAILAAAQVQADAIRMSTTADGKSALGDLSEVFAGAMVKVAEGILAFKSRTNETTSFNQWLRILQAKK